MLYKTAQDWLNSPRKNVLFFGMSGLGKTHLSNMLRYGAGWFHYSIDYRIGTRYMGEYIADYFKSEAMKQPVLRDLLLSDSIRVSSKVSFDNLTPVSSYLGKPGSADLGGLDWAEYTHRQEQFRQSEIAALQDTAHFIDRAQRIYGYQNFICDTGGSICEWVDPNDPNDPLMADLAQNCLMIWIKGDDAHTAELIRRFDRAPKPMAYQPAFLLRAWTRYLDENALAPDDVDPNAFIRWVYAQALAHRQPRYEKMAAGWGMTITADDVAGLTDADAFVALIAKRLEDQVQSA